ncbi:MAG TPA: hypothetical protein VK828_21465 [Terriglobales bacterium]|jgi:hypothetical protein|nr:hypothetical protein [Terriglobales bacterium]
MPSSTDGRIEELCARIRLLCSDTLTPAVEVELKTLAQHLRYAIKDHVRAARSSLAAKKSAMIQRDPANK